MDKVLGGCGCLVVAIIGLAIAAIVTSLLAEYLPPNVFWGIITIFLVVVASAGGIVTAFEYGSGNDSLSTGCLVPLVAFGVGFFVLSVILGWSLLPIVLAGGAALFLLFFLYVGTSEAPW